MNSLKQLGAAITVALVTSTSAQAIVITSDTSAASLAAAVATGPGLTVVGTPTLSSHTLGAATSSGTYTNLSGTYLIGGGIVLSTGNVNDYNTGPNTSTNKTTFYGPAATVAQQALLFPIDGKLSHFDVTQLNIDFTTSTGSVFFNVVFGSDEFPEFKGSTFIDAFGLYLDGVNIAFYLGSPINVDHPAMCARPGTELDGVLPCTGAPMLFSAGGLSTSLTHTLTFIIADSGDTALDSTAYISALGGTPPPPPMPEPASLVLLGLGLAAIVALRRKS